MRDRLAAVLAWIVCVTSLFVLAPSAAGHHVEGPCDFHPKTDETTEHFSKRHIRCAVELFGPVPGGRERAVCIAKRESALDPEATSATEQYLGLFQHASVYWKDRYREWTRRRWELPTSALEGRTNAIVTIRMVNDAGGWKTAGWPRHDC